jgi:hypothetical protein
MPAKTAHRIDRFRCQEQTTAITAPRLTPSRTTLMAPPPGKDSKTNSAKSSIGFLLPVADRRSMKNDFSPRHDSST